MFLDKFKIVILDSLAHFLVEDRIKLRPKPDRTRRIIVGKTEFPPPPLDVLRLTLLVRPCSRVRIPQKGGNISSRNKAGKNILACSHTKRILAQFKESILGERVVNPFG